jgi:hypothetical protein
VNATLFDYDRPLLLSQKTIFGYAILQLTFVLCPARLAAALHPLVV